MIARSSPAPGAPSKSLSAATNRNAEGNLLRQRGIVIWLYGLSGAGKSTLAIALEHRLHAQNIRSQLLDGDQIRGGLSSDLGFSDLDRSENIRRVAEVAKLFLQGGAVTICSLITPLRTQRALARDIIGARNFLEVFVSASFQTCAKRDPKGLYARAAAGQLPSFTGWDATFEAPSDGVADIILETEMATVKQSLALLYDFVLPRLKY